MTVQVTQPSLYKDTPSGHAMCAEVAGGHSWQRVPERQHTHCTYCGQRNWGPLEQAILKVIQR